MWVCEKEYAIYREIYVFVYVFKNSFSSFAFGIKIVLNISIFQYGIILKFKI